MDTLVTIEVVHASSDDDCAPAIERAFDRFRQVESICSRFDPGSELRQLSSRAGAPVEVSAVLFEALRFALAVAAATGGAFDPAIGATLERAGFDRNFRTGERVPPSLDAAAKPTYRDVVLDERSRRVTLLRPLVMDLGAVAKGLAIDLAARDLRTFGNFAIDAGGDIFVAGRNAAGSPWPVEIRDPREPAEVFATLAVSEVAVCTSGDYERRATGGGHHIIHPGTGRAAAAVASVTVVAPTAMAADALATAAFVLGPVRGLRFLREQGAEGLMLTTGLRSRQTAGMRHFIRPLTAVRPHLRGPIDADKS